MRKVLIVTATAIAMLGASASEAQAVSGSSSVSGLGPTLSRATAGPGGAFSHAQSGPVRTPASAGRSNNGHLRPVGPRPGRWNNGAVRQVPPRATSWSNSQSRRWVGPRGQWNGNRWTGGSRWGGRVAGRWHGGHYAPGGWGAYRRPFRGWQLPSYWYAPGFIINDWAAYGLGAPPYGYTWSRYYDDAVLLDPRGRVYDDVGGLDWGEYAGAYDDGDYNGGEPPVAPEDYRDDYESACPDDGVGGAIVGGAIGAGVGNLLAGRGDKFGGTLIGAGVGAIAGAAIDQAEDRGRRVAPSRYGAPYAPPSIAHAPHTEVVQDGGTRVHHAGGSYYGGGYAGGTTVIVHPTVTTITTTTYVYEDAVPLRTVAKRAYRSKAKCKCAWR